MRNLRKHQTLEDQMHFICDKCYYQFAVHRPDEAASFTRQIENIKSLYDKHVISEGVYQELLKLTISVYIGNQVTATVSDKLNSVLRERLSPRRILESLALAP